MPFTIAIVGRPNVGKSTLFNRLAGKRLALVDDQPGLTRDRREADAELGTTAVRLIDTAGLEHGDAGLTARMRQQTVAAIKQADLVVFLIDARTGIVAGDEIFAELVRESGKPVILAANKCEGRAAEAGMYEAFSLGLGDPLPISAEHDLGIGDLSDAIQQAARGREGPAEIAEPRGEEEEELAVHPLRIAVVGRPNVGKSTLVKHAIGLLKPTAGRVLVDGKDTRSMSVAQIARVLGYVFQSPTHMLYAPTVREELEFGPKNLEFKKDVMDKAVSESLSTVNLNGLEEYPPLGLSFGQQKRTTIAAVLAMRSQIMIMDEPTAGQDYANYTHFMDAMCRPSTDGSQSLVAANFAATLFISHDLDLAVTYANRVLLVGDRHIVADGPPEEVLKDFDLLTRYRVRPTSLLRLNLELLPRTRRFLAAEELAAYA
jgi:small GTP-binding protein